MTRMKFNEDYERRNPRDNDLQIRVEAGTEVEVKKIIGTYCSIKTEQPCTKNGNKEFNMSGEEISKYLSVVEST